MIASNYSNVRDIINVCQDCNVSLEIRSDEYICPSCGRITPYLDGSFGHDTSRDGGNYCHYNSCASDPLRELFDNIMSMLVTRFEAYNKKDTPAPPISMATNVAQIFVEIQRNTMISGRPIARRGDVRDEILALILLSECHRARINGSLSPAIRIRKYDITRMLGLRTDGFARGKEQLLSQAEIGNIIIDTDRELYKTRISAIYNKSIGVYIHENHTALESMLTAHHLRFIRKVITVSVKYGIGNRSQIQSRIVGAIWYIIRTIGYQYSAQLLEQSTDGIKSGTFSKFTRILSQNATMCAISKLYFPQI
jgi:hypothetical protein